MGPQLGDGKIHTVCKKGEDVPSWTKIPTPAVFAEWSDQIDCG